jgi:hypothetical protein
MLEYQNKLYINISKVYILLINVARANQSKSALKIFKYGINKKQKKVL